MRNIPKRRVPAALVFVITFMLATPIRANVDTEVYTARAAAQSGQFEQACLLGIAAMEAHPEDQWDRPTLHRFIVEVSDRWFPRLSPEKKRAVRAVLDPAQSPAAIYTRAYADWKLGNRQATLDALMPLVHAHPDSVGAQFAISGYLQVVWNSLGQIGITGIISNLLDIAPNNPSTSWALTRLAWRYGPRGEFDQARKVFAPIAASKAETRAGRTAQTLIDMLNAIDAADYAVAFDKLTDLRDYLSTGTPASLIMDTFCSGIDFDAPDAKLTALRQVFTTAALTDPDDQRRSFAWAILARTHEKQGNIPEAVAALQKVADIGDYTLASYGMMTIGRLLADTDPDGAIAALEAFREEQGPASVAGSEGHFLRLGRLYLRQKQYDKAHELYTWLQAQSDAGEFLYAEKAQDVAVGLAHALLKQDKEADARAVLSSYLDPLRYGTPLDQLTKPELLQLNGLLQQAGFTDEAVLYQRELNKR
jgi:tetratricopeptide (TPR) repeat protein